MARESNAQAAARLATVIRVAESKRVEPQFTTSSGPECQCGTLHGDGAWGYQWANDEFVAQCQLCRATDSYPCHAIPRTIEHCLALHAEFRRHYWALSRATRIA